MQYHHPSATLTSTAYAHTFTHSLNVSKYLMMSTETKDVVIHTFILVPLLKFMHRFFFTTCIFHKPTCTQYYCAAQIILNYHNYTGSMLFKSRKNLSILLNEASIKYDTRMCICFYIIHWKNYSFSKKLFLYLYQTQCST